MEPIFLKEIYKDYLWGGTRLKNEFNKDTKMNTVAESWEVSANPNGDNLVENTQYKGMFLSELFAKDELRESIFGTNAVGMKIFPILIKFIDANKELSIQVHPNDEYARKYENSFGKNELWYIMDCDDDATLICGLNSNDDLTNKDIINSGIEKYLNYVSIKKGDSIYIPAGLVHAIKKNVFICEIQQNSDITYRIYDYDRVDKNGQPRQLHVDKAIDVINADIEVNLVHENNCSNQTLINNEIFKIERLNIENSFKDISSKESFYAYSVIEGTGIIVVNNKEFVINKGKSFLVASNTGEYEIKGKLKVLKVRV